MSRKLQFAAPGATITQTTQLINVSCLVRLRHHRSFCIPLFPQDTPFQYFYYSAGNPGILPVY